MRIENYTSLRLPLLWLQKVLDELGVNPRIFVHYSDHPDEPNANCVEKIRGKIMTLDGIALDDNEVHIYLGSWENGKLRMWSAQYLKWIFAHELRHQQQFYNRGGSKDKYGDKKPAERDTLEEADASRYANSLVGTPKKDYPILRAYKKRPKV